MAPISEKRTQPQAHIKDSSSHAAHTKENASGGPKPSKRGIEILDFHESWLEEMEIYKDKLYVQKHQHHQLLGSHNHLHALQGCQLEFQIDNSINHQNSSNNTSSNNNKNVIASTNPNANTANNLAEKTIKRRGVDQLSAKQRIVARHATAATASSGNCSDGNTNENMQLILKRSREESTSQKSNSGYTKRQTHTATRSPANNNQAHGTVKAANGTSANATTGATTKNSKIIVNQFHASSLLFTQQNDEKSKLLTQNGLTKLAASAYETSLYASNYLPKSSKSIGGNVGGSKSHNNEHHNYVGVALAKSGDIERARGGGYGDNANDDPCAAIDDVNEYSESDSEEEYTGQPFYLLEDSEVTHQSKNIRASMERSSSSEEEDSGGECERPVYHRPKSILSPSLFPNVPPYLNFSSHADKGPAMPVALHRVLKWKLSPVMPKIVKRVVLNSGFRIIKNTTDWMAIWEKHMKSPGFRTIRSHQKYNHMPGSFRIGRKDSMWRCLHNNIRKFGTKEFGFMQRSYVLPEDLESLRQVWPKNASKLTKWIVKPPASARGTGIRVVNKWSQFPKDRPLVVQKYIERPLLINDNKFDMRIYVILTSINPLRIYLCKDGLARFASVKYSSEMTSLDDRCMHLTNYSINKYSHNYSKNEDFNACQGHKWTLQSLWSCLENRGVNTNRLWATLRNLIIKAFVSGESCLNRTYRQNVNFRYNCVEMFGFDVLLDENIVPWLLEINISPSLHSELPLDLHVKGPMIQAYLNTCMYQVPPKLNEKQQREIREELNLEGPLCYDKRMFTTCLTAEEVRKHNLFTNRSIEYREEYVDAILENLLPDDVRCLIIAEDELARCKPLERIFPTSDSHIYLRFLDNPRYYNRLIDAWETKYGSDRHKGIELLSKFCRDGYHLQVSDAALEKEPNVTLTEIDMMHTKKLDIIDSIVPLSKNGSPDLNLESLSRLINQQHVG